LRIATLPFPGRRIGTASTGQLASNGFQLALQAADDPHQRFFAFRLRAEIGQQVALTLARRRAFARRIAACAFTRSVGAFALSGGIPTFSLARSIGAVSFTGRIATRALSRRIAAFAFARLIATWFLSLAAFAFPFARLVGLEKRDQLGRSAVGRAVNDERRTAIPFH
jgi:hypothetical protein